ncbi:dynamin GTPase [Pyrenophora seminiperda CCB06]|uniref:Dynamin GTPase n=1 Tax=Pyrenophora seminiperda CCB06 TaxID=1302712 RepID=A0A3M7LVS6_9PLEO|nr:dynamin GTPase [Pyrenophora seminiperda CCB06]
MVTKSFDTRVVHELCSKDQLDLLDSVDLLRSQGIDHYVSLPQIIVCGDQSSGKSSVLEAISGVSFPVKSNLCTRFPTELVLRKTLKIGVSVSIVPDRSRSRVERESLSSFHETLDSFTALPTLIENAKTAMAIGSLGRAFSKDLLRVEVSGPDRPHLTIVDLPGLIHSETKQQSAADIELVQDVVKSYMKEPRSIILAVVSAKNDYANQVVLKLARAADRTGTRTLGVITKPDTLSPGSDSEAMYISLAKNFDVEFRLGWHVLKNMDSESGSGARSNRDEEESHFFSKGIWPTLPESILGIVPLRERLSKVLLVQIAAELPSLVDEIELKSAACRTELQKLGQPRASIEEQRRFLVTLSQSCQALTKAAVDGTYNDDFFGNAKTDAGYQKRIRAVVQNLNQSFSETMAREGHRYVITDSSDASLLQASRPKENILSRSEFLKRIEFLMNRTRGRELPGTFNPMVVSDLFFEQSSPWEELARAHIVQVVSAVRAFLRHLTSHVSDISTCGALFQTLVEPALERISKDVKSKTAELLASHQRGHPITYNHYFTEMVQQVREKRITAELTRIIQDVFGVSSLHPSGKSQCVEMDYRPLLDALVAHRNPDLNQYACSEALDCMQAYYKVALKRFVDDIAVEAVEKDIIAKLSDIVSPIRVTSLASDVVTDIAGESKESRAKRSQLEIQLGVLVQGLDTCKRFMVKTLQDTPDTPTLRHSFRDSLSDLSLNLPSTEPHGNVTNNGLEEAGISHHEAHDEWTLPTGHEAVSERESESLEDEDLAGPMDESTTDSWASSSAKVSCDKKKTKKKGKKLAYDTE